MKKVIFLDKRTEKVIGSARSCDEFVSIALSVRLKDREFIIGRPFKKAYGIVLFQNAWTGRINPYWTKYFKCKGVEITMTEARELFSSQLPVPLDRRPSQNQKSSGKKKTSRNPKGPGSQWRKFPPFPKPSSDFVRSGTHNVTGNFGTALNVGLHNVSYRQTDRLESVKTPNFKNIKKKNLPWNNYRRWSYQVEETFGQANDVYSSGSTLRTGYVRGITNGGRTAQNVVEATTMNNSLPDTTASAALSKCLVRSKSMSVNLAQAYAERRQTVSLMTSSVNRLVSFAVALKKGNVKHALAQLKHVKGNDTVKSVAVFNSYGTHIIGRRYVHIRRPDKSKGLSATQFADLWLEYQYGWRPLLSDIYGSAEKLANTYYLKKIIQVSATAHADDRLPLTPSSTYETAYLVRRNRSRVVFQFEESNDLSNVLSSTGVSNPALLAWELVPYSFVVDWFIPIGNFLNTLDATVGLNFKRGSTSRKFTVNLISRMKTGPIGNPGEYRFYSGTEIFGKREFKSRTIYTTVPFPPFPSFEPSLGKERMLSAISLLTQLFYRGKTTVRL